MVFIVFIFSLLVNSGVLARLCVDAAVPKLHTIALLSMWNSPAFRARCVEFSLWEKSQLVKEQPCPPQIAACGEGGEDFSLQWPCLQHRHVEVSRGAGEEPFHSNHCQVAAGSAVSYTGWVSSDCLQAESSVTHLHLCSFWLPHHNPCSWA